jgi:hypothetical protein
MSIIQLRVPLLDNIITTILLLLLLLMIAFSLSLRAKALLLKIVKAYNDNSHIVESSPKQSIFYYVFHPQPNLLMYILALLVSYTVPHTLNCLLIIYFVVDAITCQNNEIVIVRNPERLYIGHCYYHIFVASSLLYFGFDVTKSPAY